MIGAGRGPRAARPSSKLDPMSRLFGTDGVRGLANGLLTAELALQLAQAAAVVLGHARNTKGTRPRAVVARDPRASGEFIGAAVEAGLASSGIDVYDAGVLPTPAAAYLVADLDADFGVMISASHNPAPDNGIKFFARGGQKLPDDVENAIEEQLGKEAFRPVGGEVGRIQRFSDAEDRYIVHLLGTLPHRLDGLKVVLDCAHGAASGCSPQVFKDAGADVVVIGAEPDGLNINDGVGSTHLGLLKSAVVAHGADLGIAHDGDADRCLAVDHEGNEVDGDEIMAILAVALKAAGKLKDDVLVATVMSNLGLKIALREAGISLRETGVGDRYVLEAMRDGGFNLGGEQSGHVIFADHATTGDGVLTGLQIAAQVALTGRPLKELAKVMTKLPQVLINVDGVDRTRVNGDEAVAAAVAAAEAELGDTGRVLLRPSGTEPVVRVMVEAGDQATAQAVAERLAHVVRTELALALVAD
jgi:phosphoglucosamine mutase